MSSSQSDRSEETIRPIARPRRTPESVPAAAPTDSKASQTKLIAGAAAVLLLGVAVFFLLPGEPEEVPLPVEPVIVETPDEPVEVVPALSEEERRRLDSTAQRDLATLLTQQEQLRTRGAEDWGGEDWTRYIELATAGDDAYLEQDVQASADAYAEALQIGESLLSRSEQLFDQFVADGFAALEAADWMTAREQFAAALAVKPDDAEALEGRDRAQALPEVLELIAAAEDADDEGNLPETVELYRAALAIDGAWTPARDALASATRRLAQYEFDQQLDAAYGALAESRFQDALNEFDAALNMRPDSQAAKDGRFQAEEGLRLGQINLARIRALAFETRELWSDAIAQYEAALETDPTLEYALEGLERSRTRRDLELKLLNLLDNPRTLFNDSALAEAQNLRIEAAEVQPRGPQLEDQISRLDTLITAATREYPIALVSDGLTNVTLFRVGTIGSFMATEINLRPGNYTAIGSRNGFRDVRRQFTVLPGRDPGPIEVICQEPI